MTYGMKCFKCKKHRTLRQFPTEYDLDRPVCIKCPGKKIIIKKKPLRFRFKKSKILSILKMKDRKNKKTYYPKEFTRKRKLLLSDAREGNGCTECGTVKLLQVHHIDKNIMNNSDYNLKVLCYDCHSNYHDHMKGRKPPPWLK